jgi:predicted nucleotidyltransferase
MEAFAGFSEFEQYIYRSAAEREGRHDAPSAPGDLDLTIYGLRKFLRLALQGNPQILQTLFVPREKCVKLTALGEELQDLSFSIISKQAGRRYLGYLESQKQRLMGERGQKKVNRPELEEKFGYDTKYAMHILRLGFQGVELLSTGHISMPMTGEAWEFTYHTRLGKVPLQDVLTRAGELERELKDLTETGPMPETPDREQVESWMLDVYKLVWAKGLEHWL